MADHDKLSQTRRQAARRHTGAMLEMLRGRPSSPSPPADTAPAPTGYTAPPPRRAAEVREAALPKPNKPKPPPAAPNPLRPVADRLYKPGSHLKRLLGRTERLVRIQQVLQAYLPGQLQDHTRLARCDAQSWVLQTDSPAWATRLRFSLPRLRKELAHHLGEDVPPLEIRVAPRESSQTPPPRRMQINPTAANLLEDTARDVGDPALSQALRRLAGHARGRGE